MIAGIKAHTRFYSEMAIEEARAKGRELYLIEAATHVVRPDNYMKSI
jgi:hypothetical protein